MPHTIATGQTASQPNSQTASKKLAKLAGQLNSTGLEVEVAVPTSWH